jgi:hypothetical protein
MATSFLVGDLQKLHPRHDFEQFDFVRVAQHFAEAGKDRSSAQSFAGGNSNEWSRSMGAVAQRSETRWLGVDALRESWKMGAHDPATHLAERDVPRSARA